MALPYAAFTLNGFDDQERNLTFVKTDFQVLKLKFYFCNILQNIFFIKYISRNLVNTKILLYKLLRSVPDCQTCMCKRGIKQLNLQFILLYLRYMWGEGFC